MTQLLHITSRPISAYDGGNNRTGISRRPAAELAAVLTINDKNVCARLVLATARRKHKQSYQPEWVLIWGRRQKSRWISPPEQKLFRANRNTHTIK